ncbi:dihydrodipicolinate synthase family protein [Mycolicibacterium sp. YH-1]|uniref:dihydrodipicolinate synthase family protein n=1 Tax=Mycolicibacterium sp. YH-1 TaxID=2908837 RepID=UPI001F4C499C|nr:dihydrodipicolinate synthase family protein [Mycolicibacterium sp. YH-1]UNB54580.1 dihydrodipicolinate synthase family protein [Mycolicibacterium sp. YH-1]
MTADATSVVVPLVTPVNSAGEVSTACLSALISTLAGRVDGYITGLSTGEGWKLTESQWVALTESAVAHAGRVPVYAGILRPTTDEVCRLARLAPGLGVNGVVVTQPFGIDVDAHDAIRHFASIYEDCELPIILYHEDALAKTLLDSDVLAEIIQRADIAAIKDSSGCGGADPWRRLPPIRRLQGNETLLHTDPADGAIVGLANLEPALIRQTIASKPQAAERIATAVARYQLQAPNWYQHLKEELHRRGVITSADSLATSPSPDPRVSNI